MIGRRILALAACTLAAAAVVFPAGAAVGDWTSYTWSNGVNDIAVSGNTLWWATTGGAVRTDLTSFETEVLNRARGTLVSDTLTAVCVAPDGTVWFGSADRAVSAYIPSSSSWRRIQGIDGLPDPRVRTLSCLGTSLWVGTSRGFAEFRDGLVTSNSCEQGIDLGCGLVSFDVRAILLSGSTRWFGTALGVSRFSVGDWDTLNTGLVSRAVSSLVTLDGDVWCVAGTVRTDGKFVSGSPYRWNGDAWVRTDAGVAEVNTRRLVVLDGDLHAVTEDGLYAWNGAWTRIGSHLDATCAARDDQGRIWVGTVESGVFRWDGSAWNQLLAPGPRSERSIRSLAIADDGALWFTHTYPVLGSYSSAGWTQYSAGNTGGGLEDQWPAGLQLTGNGDLWVGHCCCEGDVNCRVDRRSPGGGWTGFPAIRDVMSIAEDPSGDLWFGTVRNGTEDVANGVYFLAHDDSTQTRLLVADTGGCLTLNQVRVLIAPSDGRVIFGTPGDGVAIWDYGPSVTDLTDDDCTSYRQSSGDLRGDDITALLLRGGDLWVGSTAGISVITLSSGASRFISTSQGLVGDQVNGLASDPLGRVWAATRAGVSVITPAGSGQTIESFTYPELVNDRVTALGVDERTGLVWFGTDRGLSSYQAWDPNGTPSGGIEVSVYPNPYRPAVDGALSLRADVPGILHGEIYDLSGRRVASFSGATSGGSFWDGTASSGAAAPSGHYVIVIRTASGDVARAHVAILR